MVPLLSENLQSRWLEVGSRGELNYIKLSETLYICLQNNFELFPWRRVQFLERNGVFEDKGVLSRISESSAFYYCQSQCVKMHTYTDQLY